MARKRVVYFAHGKESGPWGTKIQHLARVAEDLGFAVESPDYTGMDHGQDRVEKLLSLQPAADETMILVGSSLGGWVSLKASERLQPQGLFLMAPAVGFTELGVPASPAPRANHVLLVHGWQDEIVPVENVLTFAKEHQVALQLLPSDHRLTSQLEFLSRLFRVFLQQTLHPTKRVDPRTEWEREQEAKYQRETTRQTQPRIPR